MEMEVAEAEEAATGITPGMLRDRVATVTQVAGDRLPDGKGRRPVPLTMTLTTETMTRALMEKTRTLIRDARTSLSNVGSQTH